MSVRGSIARPSICSGAMYGKVPVMVPVVVIGSDTAAVGESFAGTSECRASPKSSNRTPVSVSMTFPGLRSRWTIPARWAATRALAIWSAVITASARLSGPRPSRIASVSPATVLHDQVVQIFLLADVEQRADVRMRQRGNGPRLAFEPSTGIGTPNELRRQHLDGNGLIEAGITCAIHLAHAARPERAGHDVRAETGTSRERAGSERGRRGPARGAVARIGPKTDPAPASAARRRSTSWRSALFSPQACARKAARSWGGRLAARSNTSRRSVGSIIGPRCRASRSTPSGCPPAQ